jgi:hypothetical protein
VVTQTLCCIPRHPAEGTRARLDGLPETQKLLWSVLTAARDEVRSSEQRPTMDPTVHAAAMAAMGTMQELQAAAAAAGSAAAVAVDEVQQRQGKGEGAQGEPERKEKGEMESELFSTMGAELNLPAAATYSAPSGAAVAETMRTAGWAPQYVELVQRVLIARGGCKVFPRARLARSGCATGPHRQLPRSFETLSSLGGRNEVRYGRKP